MCQTARKRDPVSAPNRDPHRRLRSGRPRSPWRGPARDAQCPHKRRSGARGEALWTPGGDPRWARTVGSGAVFEAPALVAGFENVAVMGQAIEQRRRHLGVAEYARPFGEGEICRQDDRGALVKAADQVEQHLPAADREWQVTQLVEDDEIDADELIGEAPGFSGTRFGLELIDQVDCGEEPNARAVAHAIGADRYRYMALAALPVPPISTALRWVTRKPPSCSSRTSPWLTGETEKSNSARFFMTGKRATPSR